MWFLIMDDNKYISMNNLRKLLDKYLSYVSTYRLDMFLTEAESHALKQETVSVWYIVCETGCLCCSYKNYNLGYWTNPEEPKQLIAKWLRGEDNPLASQYYPYGKYALVETQAEILPDGRVIIDDTIYDKNILSGETIFND